MSSSDGNTADAVYGASSAKLESKLKGTLLAMMRSLDSQLEK